MNKVQRALFGKNIRYYRKRKGWSQTRLGMELGLTFSTICSYEIARYGLMTKRRILQFCQALNVSEEQLFDANNTDIPDNKYLEEAAYNKNIRRIRRQKNKCKKRLGRFI